MPLMIFSQESLTTNTGELERIVVETQDGGHRARAICDLAATRGNVDILVAALDNPNVDIKYHVMTLMDKFSLGDKKRVSEKLLSITLWTYPNEIDGEERAVERQFDEESRRFLGNVVGRDLSKQTLFDANVRGAILSELGAVLPKKPAERMVSAQPSGERTTSDLDTNKPMPFLDGTGESVAISKNAGDIKVVIVASVFGGIVIFMTRTLWLRKGNRFRRD